MDEKVRFSQPEIQRLMARIKTTQGLRGVTVRNHGAYVSIYRKPRIEIRVQSDGTAMRWDTHPAQPITIADATALIFNL